MSREMICINCPMGCRLTVDDADKANITVTGNTCPRGVTYAVNEVTAPKRMVTDAKPVSLHGHGNGSRRKGNGICQHHSGHACPKLGVKKHQGRLWLQLRRQNNLHHTYIGLYDLLYQHP